MSLSWNRDPGVISKPRSNSSSSNLLERSSPVTMNFMRFFFNCFNTCKIVMSVYIFRNTNRFHLPSQSSCIWQAQKPQNSRYYFCRQALASCFVRQPAKTFTADKEQRIKRNELERKDLEEQKAKDKEQILSIELKHNTLAMKVPNSGPKKVLILLPSPEFHPNSEIPIKVPNSKSWIGSTESGTHDLFRMWRGKSFTMMSLAASVTSVPSSRTSRWKPPSTRSASLSSKTSSIPNVPIV